MPKAILIGVIIIFLLVVLGYYWYQLMIKTEEHEQVEPDTEPELAEPRDEPQVVKPEPIKPKVADPEPEATIPEPTEPEEITDKATEQPFQAGMNLLIYGHPQQSRAVELFEYLSQLGVNSIAIVFPLFQEDWQANMVTADPAMTPTLEEIEELILAAHEQELSVMLRPILDEQSIMKSGHWRGNIRPTNVESWFESYRLLLLDYAQLAQTTNVEFFNIGTELNSLQKNNYSAQWIQLIKDIRDVYQGKLIYSFNWDVVAEIPKSEFVPQLDYVGIDAYFPLDVANQASVAMLEESWATWSIDIADSLAIKPVFVTEAGMIPVTGAYRTPYAWSIPGGKFDPQAQANYYQATFNMWRPLVEGIYWWTVTLEPLNTGVIDYSPLRPPTEAVLRHLFLE